MTEMLEVRNPRTGKYDYEIDVADAAAVASLARTLRGNQPAWRDQGLNQRIETLTRFRDALAANGDDIVTALSADTGRHLIARGELDGLMRTIDRWCHDAPALVEHAERASVAMPQVGIRSQFVPYPLIGAISPWNFPLLLSFIDVTPALLAGCAAIIKPSEVTPRFAAPVTEAINQVPELAGVLAFALGDGRTGATLIEQVDAVAFTGSVATGQKVAAAAANAFIPAFLELGGKDAAIVLDGSDVDRAATAILRASVAATGQACQSLERVYVAQNHYDEFVDCLARKARNTPLSYPDPRSGIVGPLIFAKQADIIASHLADATEKGATVHAGGEVQLLDGGYWIEPTVLANVDHDMRVMREETFGPIMPVMSFSSEAEAVRLANDSDYGLSGAVFGPTEADAVRVAEQLEAGGVSVNDAGMTTMIFEAQKSAFRMSGMGQSRMGPSGLTRFFRQKALYLNRGDVMPVEVLTER